LPKKTSGPGMPAKAAKLFIVKDGDNLTYEKAYLGFPYMHS